MKSNNNKWAAFITRNQQANRHSNWVSIRVTEKLLFRQSATRTCQYKVICFLLEYLFLIFRSVYKSFFLSLGRTIYWCRQIRYVLQIRQNRNLSLKVHMLPTVQDISGYIISSALVNCSCLTQDNQFRITSFLTEREMNIHYQWLLTHVSEMKEKLHVPSRRVPALLVWLLPVT